ncbi:TetR family transcriptional regulator [Bacillus sp. MUM 116]|uniref:TetR/AcrR family transcriptional regulator n=1 Tax=Bacillus sp. MUM 116 TaxID=1678002 RepID=UPI0008F5B17A|nr:TetR/AcrR family transcriptional regulator [Bacillus sp. MUM 116]OIK07657.1 TetR family transcriptional regulator [Bacillus sp. MUM 116]
MPKPTFLNLSTEKQESLIKAAKKEFSRVPLYEASISNIIKDAGIPRGSFYQYFEDKEDLFYFLLDEHSKRNHERFISILNMNNGDLFQSFLDWFKSTLIAFEEPENRQYFKNTFLNMNYRIEKTITQNIFEERAKNRFFGVINSINSENLNVTNEEELHHIFRIMMAVTMRNLVAVFAKDVPMNQAMKAFSLEITLLKRGLCKQTL